MTARRFAGYTIPDKLPDPRTLPPAERPWWLWPGRVIFDAVCWVWRHVP